MKFLGLGFQKLQHKQDRDGQTDATERITNLIRGWQCQLLSNILLSVSGLNG